MSKCNPTYITLSIGGQEITGFAEGEFDPASFIGQEEVIAERMKAKIKGHGELIPNTRDGVAQLKEWLDEICKDISISGEAGPKHPNLGSSFDDFLIEEGILEECEAEARKRVRQYVNCVEHDIMGKKFTRGDMSIAFICGATGLYTVDEFEGMLETW